MAGGLTLVTPPTPVLGQVPLLPQKRLETGKLETGKQDPSTGGGHRGTLGRGDLCREQEIKSKLENWRWRPTVFFPHSDFRRLAKKKKKEKKPEVAKFFMGHLTESKQPKGLCCVL